MADDMILMIILVVINGLSYGMIGFIWWFLNRMDITFLVERTNNGGWRKVKEVKSSRNSTEIHTNGKTYLLSGNGIMDGGKIIRTLDYNTGKELVWAGEKGQDVMSPKELDDIIGSHFLRDIIRGIKMATSMSSIWMIVLVIAVLVVGLVVGWFMGSSSHTIIVENIKKVV